MYRIVWTNVTIDFWCHTLEEAMNEVRRIYPVHQLWPMVTPRGSNVFRITLLADEHDKVFATLIHVPEEVTDGEQKEA